MASESEGVPPQPVRSDGVKSSDGQAASPSNAPPTQPGSSLPPAAETASPANPVERDSVEPQIKRSEASAASLSGESAEQKPPPVASEAPPSPPGTVSQSDAPAPASLNPEGFPAAELERTPPVGGASGTTPSDPSRAGPHDHDPYHQEHQHDYGSEHPHGDSSHDPYHAHNSGQNHGPGHEVFPAVDNGPEAHQRERRCRHMEKKGPRPTGQLQ